jgi:hypothetical protein
MGVGVSGCQDERLPEHPDTVSGANHHPIIHHHEQSE